MWFPIILAIHGTSLYSNNMLISTDNKGMLAFFWFGMKVVHLGMISAGMVAYLYEYKPLFHPLA